MANSLSKDIFIHCDATICKQIITAKQIQRKSLLQSKTKISKPCFSFNNIRALTRAESRVVKFLNCNKIMQYDSSLESQKLTSRCKHLSFVKAKASSPYGSPSTIFPPGPAGLAAFWQLIPIKIINSK